MLRTDAQGRVMTAGQLAILRGEVPDYPGGLAPNSPPPKEAIKRARAERRNPPARRKAAVASDPGTAQKVAGERGGKRSKAETAERDARIAKAAMAGETTISMAEKFGISRYAIRCSLQRSGHYEAWQAARYR